MPWQSGGGHAVLVLFAIDISQNRDAIRKSCPVVGRCRDPFITLGESFRAARAGRG